MENWIGLGAAIFLVAANGFFVATEFAIVKVRSTRLDELARSGVRGAEGARRVLGQLDEYLSATQLGITLASLGLGWLGEPAFAHLVEPVVLALGLPASTAHAVAIAAAFTIITFLHIVFGELAPKSLAIQRPEGVTLAVASPMRLIRWIFYPAIWALNGLAAKALKAVGLQTVSETELGHSEEELRLIVSAMRDTGGAPRERLDMLERALRLPNRTARELMVARGDVVYMRADMSLEEQRQLAVAAGHTRYPVVEEDLDVVLGILNLKDLFLRGELPDSERSLRSVLREPLYVPETMRADVLLREFRRKRQHMAVVVDEYGGTAGLVTVEDVVAAVLGELHDEFATGGPSIVPMPAGVFAVDPATPLEDFADYFAVELEEPEVSTIGGLIMVRLDRVPHVGDKVVVSGIELTVEAMKGPRLLRISARRSMGPQRPAGLR